MIPDRRAAGTNVITRVLGRGKQEAQSQRKEQKAMEAEVGVIRNMEASRRDQPCRHHGFSAVRPFGTSDLQNCTIVSLCCFQLPRLWLYSRSAQTGMLGVVPDR